MVPGLTETLLRAGGAGVTVTPNTTVAPGYAAVEAVRLARVELVTLPAVTVNVVEVEPWGTVTLEGTVAAVVLELESDTTTPPVPAADVRLTVPVPDLPLTIVLGLTEILLKAGDGGLTVTPKVAFTPE